MADNDLLGQIKQTLENAPKVPVDSECVATLSYDVTTEELTIEFQKRGTYKYSEVPLQEYLNFKEANSIGYYFNLYIRDRYPFERIA